MNALAPSRQGLSTREVAARVGIPTWWVNRWEQLDIVRPSVRRSNAQGSPCRWGEDDVVVIERVVRALTTWRELSGQRQMPPTAEPFVRQALQCIAYARKRDIVVASTRGTFVVHPGTTVAEILERAGSPVLVLHP